MRNINVFMFYNFIHYLICYLLLSHIDYCTSAKLRTAISVVGDRNGNSSSLYVLAQIPPLNTITYGTNDRVRRDIPFPEPIICGDCFARTVSIFENYTKVQGQFSDDDSTGRQVIIDNCPNEKMKKRYWKEYSMASAGMGGMKTHDVVMWWWSGMIGLAFLFFL